MHEHQEVFMSALSKLKFIDFHNIIDMKFEIKLWIKSKPRLTISFTQVILICFKL
jgi:hypothetical protein